MQHQQLSDAEVYAVQLANMAPAENKSMPAVQFQLGEAMINQKKIRQTTKDIGQLKDILTEMQIYVQRHHVKINKDLVEKTELQIAVESLQTKLETRFDMNQLQQMDRIKMMIEGFVTEKQLDGRLVEKLHKREFEKQFERLDNSYAALEAKVINTIPALSYEFKVGLETKASQRDLDQMREEKASLVLVEALVKRLNKIEEAQLKGNFVAPQAQAQTGQKPASKQGKKADGELSELEEVDEDDNLSVTQGTQDNFNAGKTDRTNNNDSSFKTQAVTETNAGVVNEVGSGVSAAQITNLQASFTKQLDTMQAIISQHLDTRLLSFNQMIEESGKMNTDRFSDLNADLNLLKADVQLLQTNQKKVGLGNPGGKSPMMRQESKMSLDGGDRSPTNNASTNQLNTAIRRIEEQLQNLQLKFQADQQLKQQNNSVDIFALSKQLENSIRKIEQKNEEHLKRVVQTELRANSTQVEVQSIGQELKNKISKIGKDLLRTVNLKEEVRIRIDQFSQTLQAQSDQFFNSLSNQNNEINQMKEVIKGELKDLKSANQNFHFELDRNQQLFRQLQSELIATIEEKKEQNESILNTVSDAALKAQKESKREGLKNRSQSVSQQPSIASLLPQLKTVTEQSVTKLTHRQLRVIDLLKGQRSGGIPSSGLISPSFHLLADQSALSLKGRFDQSDGMASHKVFMTSPSPALIREDSRNQNRQASDSKNLLSPQAQDQQKTQRKVFGAQDYLERQQKMKQLTQNGSDAVFNQSSLKNLDTNTHNPSEDFAEFHVKLGSQIGSVKQLF